MYDKWICTNFEGKSGSLDQVVLFFLTTKCYALLSYYTTNIHSYITNIRPKDVRIWGFEDESGLTNEDEWSGSEMRMMVSGSGEWIG